jgi:hypothetical protein
LPLEESSRARCVGSIDAEVARCIRAPGVVFRREHSVGHLRRTVMAPEVQQTGIDDHHLATRKPHLAQLLDLDLDLAHRFAAATSTITAFDSSDDGAFVRWGRRLGVA